MSRVEEDDSQRSIQINGPADMIVEVKNSASFSTLYQRESQFTRNQAETALSWQTLNTLIKPGQMVSCFYILGNAICGGQNSREPPCIVHSRLRRTYCRENEGWLENHRAVTK